jgi:DNA replication protein DnaC
MIDMLKRHEIQVLRRADHTWTKNSRTSCRRTRIRSVLVVDEVGYLTYGTDAANMLFHVVNERHRPHRPMIFTTNKSLKACGRVLRRR